MLAAATKNFFLINVLRVPKKSGGPI